MSTLPSQNVLDSQTTLVNTQAFDAAPALAASASTRKLKAGETLFMEGESAPFCFEVIDGVMKEYNTLEDGRRQVADFYGCGDLFGLSELDEHLHTAEAVTACTVRCFPRDVYVRTVSASTELTRRLLETLMSRLHRARERLVLLGRMSAAQRVAAFLIRLADDQNTDDNVRVVMSRQDIADHLGLTIETVCRVLTDFKKREIIDMHSARCFSIPDRGVLESLVEGAATLH